ncbi:hypothetical protein [Lysobacter gummosus]|uniref:hypothetical protein n=1 Tax=Lysobacter gummosus TaxID=262324 RepID=UPI00362F8D0E
MAVACADVRVGLRTDSDGCRARRHWQMRAAETVIAVDYAASMIGSLTADSAESCRRWGKFSLSAALRGESRRFATSARWLFQPSRRAFSLAACAESVKSKTTCICRHVPSNCANRISRTRCASAISSSRNFPVLPIGYMCRFRDR